MTSIIDYESARMDESDALDPDYQTAVQCDCCQAFFSEDHMNSDVCPDCSGELIQVEKDDE